MAFIGLVSALMLALMASAVVRAPASSGTQSAGASHGPWRRRIRPASTIWVICHTKNHPNAQFLRSKNF
jgi:hypothetical protein